jgi:hypothetical protein
MCWRDARDSFDDSLHHFAECVSEATHEWFIASVFDAQVGRLDFDFHFMKKQTNALTVEVIDEAIQIRQHEFGS